MPKETPGEGTQMSSPGQPAVAAEPALQVSETIESFHSNLAVKEWKHRADTSRFLAYGLIILLAFAFILHFIATFVFVAKGKLEATALKDIFTSWLPVLSGLASAAATYYFTREK